MLLILVRHNKRKGPLRQCSRFRLPSLSVLIFLANNKGQVKTLIRMQVPDLRSVLVSSRLPLTSVYNRLRLLHNLQKMLAIDFLIRRHHWTITRHCVIMLLYLIGMTREGRVSPMLRISTPQVLRSIINLLRNLQAVIN